jgi:hypothetical protein
LHVVVDAQTIDTDLRHSSLQTLGTDPMILGRRVRPVQPSDILDAP